MPRAARDPDAPAAPFPARPSLTRLSPLVTITTHPSAILRSRDDAERGRAMDDFVADLARVAGWLRR
jgi:hypothetical protein